MKKFSYFLFFLFLLWWGEAGAQSLFDGVSGFFDVNFITSSTKSTDSSGTTVKTDSTGYNPRFSLSLNTLIFPTLNLTAGGVVEKNVSENSVDHESTKSTATNFRPYINLTWNSAPYTLGVGYSRREQRQESGSAPSITNINEEYNATFGWKPVDLPSLDVLYSRTNSYDKDRELQDTTSNSVLLGSRYAYKNLDLRYQANYSDQTLNLIGLETNSLTQSGRVAYSDYFLNRRVSFNTSYNISRQDSEATSNGVGSVSFQLSPFGGLSAITDTPLLVELVPNPALIDGNLTASAGIDIGLPPVGGNTRPRNMGLDFLNITEVNNLLIWVDKELPINIANFFSWDIYTSSDNLNWTFYRRISPAPFGQFQNTFDLNFPTVRTRYIKAVTRPLAPTVIDASRFPNIFITEIQAFNKRPVQDVQRKTHNTTQFFNLDSRTRILDTPLLTYDLSSFYSKTDPSGVYHYNVSNGLSLNHQFNPVLSGTARVAREDAVDQDKKEWMYLYNASLTATPLRTLTHTLVYSGRYGNTEEGSFNTNSVILTNTAELYRGVDVSLSGGANHAKRETGEKQFGTLLSLGTNIVPHRNMTFNLSCSSTTSKESGGGKPDTSDYTRSVDLSVSYTPFETLYLYGSLSVASQKETDTSYLQNYAIGWSPFRGGSLQVSVAYTESLRSEDNGRDRTFGPSLTWQITNRSTLSMSYQMVKSDSDSQKSESNAFSTRLQILF